MFEVQELFSMKGRVALVTGAASGMGRRFALTLSAMGAKVICSARRIENIEALAAEIRAQGGDAVAIALDVGSTDSVKQAFDQANEKYGDVDVLINCAGQLTFMPFAETNEAAWDNIVNVNYTGVMRMSREFINRLLAVNKPGNIVNITSITGIQATKYLSLYASTKAAVNHLTKLIAMELFGTGIRCNAIAPGYFITEMSGDLLSTDEGKAIVNNLPSKRAGTVDELDGALLLLVSNASSFMNGVVIPVDDGQVMQLLQ
ncbi:MAG: NAD(P)-dependent dehydrogenase (short-subunit alcohol dehydrogenase family) [Zhongshania sp.]|jgi:NAD(P)-dependent dehydrogenase (short-subunit alcohol dehydrogenase family)|nr:SDR family oxidoreductase [Zhongshania sp.]